MQKSKVWDWLISENGLQAVVPASFKRFSIFTRKESRQQVHWTELWYQVDSDIYKFAECLHSSLYHDSYLSACGWVFRKYVFFEGSSTRSYSNNVATELDINPAYKTVKVST